MATLSATGHRLIALLHHSLPHFMFRLTDLIARLRAGGGGLMKNSTLIIAARVSGSVLGFLTNMLLARMLGAYNLGVLYIAIGLASIMGLIASVGYPAVMVRYVTRYKTGSARQRYYQPFLQTVQRDAMLAMLVLVSLGISVLMLWPGMMPAVRLTLIIGAAIPVFYVFMIINESLCIAHRHFALGSLPELFVRPVLFFTIVLAAFLIFKYTGTSPIGMTGFILAYGGLTMLIAIVHYIIVRRTGLLTTPPPADQDTPLTPAPSGHGQLRKAWRISALPLIVVTIFTGIFADFQILLTGLFMSPDKAAIFGVALKLAFFIGFGVQAIHQIITPDIAQFRQTRQFDDMRKTLLRGNLLGLIGALGATSALLLAGPYILALFGPEFTQGQLVLILLCTTQIIRAFAGPADQLLTIAGHQNKSLVVSAIAIMLLSLLNLALTPLFGLTGAAFAVVITLAYWNAHLAWLAGKYAGHRTDLLAQLR